MRLQRSDLEALLRFVHDADELATDGTAFPDGTLARLADVVACDDIGVFEVDRIRRRNLPLDGEQDELWWEIADQHPICHYVEETGDFRALQDFRLPVARAAPPSRAVRRGSPPVRL
jgi:hypothetical protein